MQSVPRCNPQTLAQQRRQRERQWGIQQAVLSCCPHLVTKSQLPPWLQAPQILWLRFVLGGAHRRRLSLSLSYSLL
jgi:hypothetical protein